MPSIGTTMRRQSKWMSRITQADAEGRLAFERGAEQGENPYKQPTLRQGWRGGWLEAQREAVEASKPIGEPCASCVNYAGQKPGEPGHYCAAGAAPSFAVSLGKCSKFLDYIVRRTPDTDHDFNEVG